MGAKNLGECKFVLHFGHSLISTLIMALSLKAGKPLSVAVTLNFTKRYQNRLPEFIHTKCKLKDKIKLEKSSNSKFEAKCNNKYKITTNRSSFPVVHCFRYMCPVFGSR